MMIVIQKRKQALRQFNARPLHQNLENFRVFRAKARRTIRESKRRSWKQYVSRLNSRKGKSKVKENQHQLYHLEKQR